MLQVAEEALLDISSMPPHDHDDAYRLRHKASFNIARIAALREK